MFRDRKEAGKKLAEKLAPYRGHAAVVLALPRGGVVVGHAIARALNLPLDIVVTRKIGHPTSPEYAVGVVNERGDTILNESETAAVDQAWLAKEIAAQQAEAARRSDVYRAGRAPAAVAGKTAILTDDGVATGLTMRLAVRSVKAAGPAKIVVAVPVSPVGAERMFKKEGADEVVALEPPEEFLGAVGAHYAYFPQVEDSEVMKLLKK